MISYKTAGIISALVLLITILCFIDISMAGNHSVTLLQGTDKLILSQTRYVVDNEKNISQQQFTNLLMANKIHASTTMPFNQGLKTSRYWMGFSILNQDLSEQTLQLVIGASFRPLLSIHLYDTNTGYSQKLLSENHSTPFTQRHNDFRYLNSLPFTLQPNQKQFVIIEYETIGSSYLPLTLGAVDSITQSLNDDAIYSAFFYSLCISALMLFALLGRAMSNTIFILYSLLFSLGLLTVSAMEGFAFKFLWPQFPTWNHFSTLVLLYLLSVYGLWVASISTTSQTNISLRLRKLMQYLSIFSGLMAIAVFFVDFVIMAQLVNLCLLAMFAAHVYTMSTWLTLNNTRNRIALFSAIAVTLTFTLLLLLSFDSSLLPGMFYIQSTRVIYLVILFATFTVLSTHVRSLNINHERALTEALAAAKREASVNRALYESEQKYTRAKQLAALRQQQLATASHDMKQPLVSLRSTLDTLMHEQPDKIRQQLNNAFSYLDNLCSQYLQQTQADQTKHSDYEQQEPGITNETSDQQPYSINLILSTTERMFIDEARQKNISLKSCACSAQITSSPLILMRLYTNLVSNAVKHTAQGRILLGVRRKKKALCLQVIDTGCGMSEQKLKDVMQAYVKGPDSEGTGLGLAICQQLAAEHKLGFDIFSAEGHGTVCQITIPL